MSDPSDSNSLSSLNDETSSFTDGQHKSKSSISWAPDKTIILYRLKYVCAQPCSVFVRSVLSRIPSGKKVYIILLMLGLEQLAYSASSDYLINPFLEKMGVRIGDVSLGRNLVMNVIGFLMFPVMGWIADVWVGQYRMIHFSLWLLWFGYAILALLYSVDFVDVLPILFAIISVGHSGFQATAIPFGAEMIKYRTTQELSSYFHCYYWMRNLGFTVYFVTSNCVKSNGGNVVFSMTAVVCVSMALILNGLFRRWFNARSKSINPYKKVIQVLYLAMVIKRPVHRSAFSFTGAKPPSRISLTKEVHGGKFSSEEVEDVKTFLHLLVILVCVMAAMNIFTGVYEPMPTQLFDMNFTHLNVSSCDFSDRFANAFNVCLILLIIPILNFVLYPFLREYMPNMLKRIGMGVFMALMALVSILAISGAGARRGGNVSQCMFSTNFTSDTVLSSYVYNTVPKFYALLPHTLITIAEVLISVTSLEFFYAQSPHKMRGMMVGLFFFTWGLSSATARIMMFSFSFNTNTTHMTCDFWYYLLYLFFALFAFPCYVVFAQRYRNRQRGEQDSDVFYRRPTPLQTT